MGLVVAIPLHLVQGNTPDHTLSCHTWTTTKIHRSLGKVLSESWRPGTFAKTIQTAFRQA